MRMYLFTLGYLEQVDMKYLAGQRVHLVILDVGHLFDIIFFRGAVYIKYHALGNFSLEKLEEILAGDLYLLAFPVRIYDSGNESAFPNPVACIFAKVASRFNG